MVSVQAIQEQIKQHAKVSAGTSGTGQAIDTAPALIAATGSVAPESAIETVVGKAPEGFGQGFTWGREDPQALLAVYIAASDFMGVKIQGLKVGDRIVVTSATGFASFSEDHGEFEQGLVGLIATGAQVASTIFEVLKQSQS